MRKQCASQVELAIDLHSQPPLDLLRDNLAKDHLLGEIFRAHHDPALAATRRERHQAGDQNGESLRSIHPSPPSAARAMHAAGIAPARICEVSTEASPRKMKTPNPPPPIAAAIVAVPIVVTVATRIPAMIVREARGSSTSQSTCLGV